MTNKKVEFELRDSLPVMYRPKSLTDFIGNEHIKKVISGYFKNRQLVKTWLLLGDTGSGKCVSGDTLIPTDNGLIPIKKLVGNIEGAKEKAINVLTKEGVKTTSHVYCKESETIKIKTTYGYSLIGTPEHPVYILTENLNYEWKKLRDIQINDKVCITYSKGIFAKDPYIFKYKEFQVSDNNIKFPKYLNKDLARFLGYLDSSYILHKSTIFIAKKAIYDITDFISITKKLFNFSPIKTEDNLVLNSIDIITFLLKTGLINKFLDINFEAILRSPEDIIINYLSCFLNSNIVNRECLNIYLNLSTERAKQLQILLSNFGILSQLTPINSLTNNSLTQLRIEYDIEIDIFYLYTEYRNIEYTIKNYYYYDKVTSIQMCKVQKVYDLTIPKYKNYIANSFIVHNTTLARILARTLNCQNLQGIDPCEKCPSCKQNISRHSDLIEFNGTVEGSKDRIKEVLRLSYNAPTFNYKIILIDECHGLSAAAQNALLVNIEAPPPKTVWILATTEASKVKKTISGRCVEFYLNYPVTNVLAKHLYTIAKKEYGLTLSKKIKNYIKPIIEHCNNQPRNSISTLEEVCMAVKSDDNISKQEIDEIVSKITALTGTLDKKVVSFLIYMYQGKVRKPIQIVSELEPTRYEEFLIKTHNYSTYAASYIIANLVSKPVGKGHYSVNRLSFNKVLNKLDIGYKQPLLMCDVLAEAIERTRTGLLSHNQAILSMIWRYLERVQILLK